MQSGGIRDRGVNIVSVPTKSGRLATMHINRLKLWVMPQANLYRLVIAKEAEGDDQPLGMVVMGETIIIDIQKQQMDQLSSEFEGQ